MEHARLKLERIFLKRFQICNRLNFIINALVRYPVRPHTFVSPSADSRRAVFSYWRTYVHEVLVYRLGGLSLPRKSVVRLTDRPDMTIDVYRGRKTTTTQQQQQYITIKYNFTYYINNILSSKVWCLYQSN